MRIVNFLRIAVLSLALIAPTLSVAAAAQDNTVQRNGAGEIIDSHTGVQLPGQSDY